MPSPVAPPVKRVVNGKATKDEIDKMPPPLQRMAAVNRSANKYKWGAGVKGDTQ